METPQFDCLYYFSSAQSQIIEIKRTDLPLDTDINKRLYWFLYHNQTQQLQRLDFRSMDSSSSVEERYFEQGYLKFDQHTATFIEKYNQRSVALNKNPDQLIEKNLHAAIIQYLHSKSH